MGEWIESPGLPLQRQGYSCVIRSNCNFLLSQFGKAQVSPRLLRFFVLMWRSNTGRPKTAMMINKPRKTIAIGLVRTKRTTSPVEAANPVRAPNPVISQYPALLWNASQQTTLKVHKNAKLAASTREVSVPTAARTAAAVPNPITARSGIPAAFL